MYCLNVCHGSCVELFGANMSSSYHVIHVPHAVRSLKQFVFAHVTPPSVVAVCFGRLCVCSFSSSCSRWIRCCVGFAAVTVTRLLMRRLKFARLQMKAQAAAESFAEIGLDMRTHELNQLRRQGCLHGVGFLLLAGNARRGAGAVTDPR